MNNHGPNHDVHFIWLFIILAPGEDDEVCHEGRVWYAASNFELYETWLARARSHKTTLPTMLYMSFGSLHVSRPDPP